jgi:hypothetical protein
MNKKMIRFARGVKCGDGAPDAVFASFKTPASATEPNPPARRLSNWRRDSGSSTAVSRQPFGLRRFIAAFLLFPSRILKQQYQRKAAMNRRSPN